MSKSTKIGKTEAAKELAKELGRPYDEDFKKLYRKMKVYEVALPCGCCEETAYFQDDESALKAVEKPGHYDIVDGLGILHKNVDAFYGIWRKDG